MYRISIDVGGTFTDLVALNEKTGEILNIKTPSVPKSPEEGVIKALEDFLIDKQASSVHMIGHATTIATNVLFGQIDLELPKTGLITTYGFRDVIEIGRQRRAEVYNLFFERPPTLVKRRYRYELSERISPNGNVILAQSQATMATEKNQLCTTLQQQFPGKQAYCLDSDQYR